MMNLIVGGYSSDGESSCLERLLGKTKTRNVRIVRSSIEK